MWKSYLRQFGGQPEGVPQSPSAIGNTSVTFWHRQKRRFAYLRTKAYGNEKCTLRRTASLPEYDLARNGDIQVDSGEYSGYISEPHSPSLETPRKKCSTGCRFMDRPSTYKGNAEVNSSTAWRGQGTGSSGSLGEQYTNKPGQSFGYSASYAQPGKSLPQTLADSREPLLGQIFASALEIDDGYSVFDVLDSHSQRTTQSKHGENIAQGKIWRNTSTSRKSRRLTCNKRLGRSWSTDEDLRLRQYVQNNYTSDCIDWDEVGRRFNRSGVGCMTRYYYSP